MGKQLDLTGQRFGKLTVIGIDPNYIPKNGRHKTWLCKCDCGNYKVARGTRLISGYTTACSVGCKNRIEIGAHFGKLVVLGMTNERSKNGGSMMYRCRCDCGKELLVPSTELRAKRKSCCSNCKMSLGAITIESLLKENGIAYQKEYVIYDIYDNEPMQKYRYDFFLPQYNIIIEYDGEQHAKPVKQWGGLEELKRIQKRDKIKTNYCLDNGITIIRIPYTHSNNIIIDDLLENSSFKIISKVEE